MGLGIGHISSCRCYPQQQIIERVVERVVNKFPNPDPSNYKILGIEKIKSNVLVIVQYPDCTNYEGKKIMIYRNVPKEKILNAHQLDPHFCNNCAISPFARFEPTKDGLSAARKLAKELK